MKVNFNKTGVSRIGIKQGESIIPIRNQQFKKSILTCHPVNGWYEDKLKANYSYICHMKKEGEK